MGRHTLFSFLLVALMSAGVAVAENSAGSKVAVLDAQRAILRTDLAQNELKKLESRKDYADTQAKAESLKQQLMQMQSEAQKEGPTWSPEQWAEHQKNSEFLRKDFELVAQKMQSEQMVVIKNIEKQVAPKINDLLKEIIEVDNISVVIHSEAVIYAKSTVDLTDKLTEKLNQLK